jgi:hypothetical protein
MATPAIQIATSTDRSRNCQYILIDLLSIQTRYIPRVRDRMLNIYRKLDQDMVPVTSQNIFGNRLPG